MYIKFYIFFNHGNNNLPRVYPTARKPDIPITCDSAGAETSRGSHRVNLYPRGRLPFQLCHNGPI